MHLSTALAGIAWNDDKSKYTAKKLAVIVKQSNPAEVSVHPSKMTVRHLILEVTSRGDMHSLLTTPPRVSIALFKPNVYNLLRFIRTRAGAAEFNYCSLNFENRIARKFILLSKLNWKQKLTYLTLLMNYTAMSLKAHLKYAISTFS